MNLKSEIERLIMERIDDIFTVMIAKVVSVNWDNMTVTIKFKAKPDGVEYQQIPDVPIGFQQTQKAKIYMPLSQGDHVITVFSKYDVDETLRSSDLVDVDGSTFKPEYCIAMPGIFTKNMVEDTSYDGDGIKIVSDGKISIESDNIELAGGGEPIARKGDSVSVSTTTGSGEITSGSDKVESG